MANTAPETCEKCGGEMWDNRGDKKNPKQPDFKCKDKDGCGHGVWLDRRKGKKSGGAPAAAAHTPATAAPPPPMTKEARGEKLRLLLALECGRQACGRAPRARHERDGMRRRRFAGSILVAREHARHRSLPHGAASLVHDERDRPSWAQRAEPNDERIVERLSVVARDLASRTGLRGVTLRQLRGAARSSGVLTGREQHAFLNRCLPEAMKRAGLSRGAGPHGTATYRLLSEPVEVTHG